MATLAAAQPAPSNPAHKLETQAASTALTGAKDTSNTSTLPSFLDEDGRLSSASAALSLKYARHQDLPSYPSAGGVNLAAASAAASIADSNKKTFEHWKPGTIPAANTAAIQAKDYEMEPLWKPELSRAGSKAAVLATRDTQSPSLRRASESEHGQSAASSALQNRKSPPAITERTISNDARQKALMAATGAMSGSRRRSDSAPIQATNINATAGWAMKAANSTHKSRGRASPLSSDPANEASRITNARSNVSRQMYSYTPPVSIEVEEKKRQDLLKASAIAMARKMYAIQQTQIDEARGINPSHSASAAVVARRRAQSDVALRESAEINKAPPRYENLEEAARRLAQERLAKLHDEHAEYRQYYGQQTSPKKRLTLRRNRRTSDEEVKRNTSDDDSDVETSQQIKQQMSLFRSKLAEVDDKKRQADRDALLAAAHKNVTARMNAIDEKVFSETGKLSPQQRELWERQARERAQRDSGDRMANSGKIHIGGGKFLDQSEIDAIARARLQPTLDDIADRAEKQRARDEEIRQEQERIKAESAAEKQKQMEEKAAAKTAADKEKAEAKAKRDEEKRVRREAEMKEKQAKDEQRAAERKSRADAAAAEKERARQEKEETQHSEGAKPKRFPTFKFPRIVGAGAAGGAAAGATAATATVDATQTSANAIASPTEATRAALQDENMMDPGEAAHAVAAADAADEGLAQTSGSGRNENNASQRDGGEQALNTSPDSPPVTPTSPKFPTSPSKGDSRVKSWFKNRFRPGSKEQNDWEAGPESTPTSDPPRDLGSVGENKKDFDSARDVALAGRTSTNPRETDDMYGDSEKENGKISPVVDEPASLASPPGPAVDERSRSVSSLSSDTSSVLSQDPKDIAADAASSRYSREGLGNAADVSFTSHSKDSKGAVEESDDEPRGRRGFRERFLKKVVPGRTKDKKASDPQPETGGTTLQQSEANVDEPNPLAESKVKQAAVASPEPGTQAGDLSAIPAGPQSSTHKATAEPNSKPSQPNPEEEDFEEARDTFEEGLSAPPPKFIDIQAARTGGAQLVDLPSPSAKSPETPVSSQANGSTGLHEGSRFKEDL